MYKKVLTLAIAILLSGCIAKKKTTYGKKRTITVAATDTTAITPPKETRTKKTKENLEANNVIASAMTFTGVRYKYGGTTKKGMDCSGLIYVALQENNIPFPRVSYKMANEGKRIAIKKVQKGDLLFFKTNKKNNRINHVGLVVSTEEDQIKFIHSSTSRGVIVSSLREGYWNSAFIKATRIL